MSPHMRLNRKLNSINVVDVLPDLFILWSPPSYVGSDNGPEFIAEAMRAWIKAVGATTAYLEQNRFGIDPSEGYVESFNFRFRDGLVDGEIFGSPAETCATIEDWRRHYNTAGPHSALGWHAPTPGSIARCSNSP